MKWPEVVDALLLVPRLCVVKENITHLDVVNRIMRQENYMIALVNKEVLPLFVHIPLYGKTPLITATVEWALRMVCSHRILQHLKVFYYTLCLRYLQLSLPNLSVDRIQFCVR